MSSIVDYVVSSIGTSSRHPQHRAHSPMDNERQLRQTRQESYPRMRAVYYHKRNSNPDLPSFGRGFEQREEEHDLRPRRIDSHEVVVVIRDELQSQLSALREDLEAIIQPALEARQSTPQSTAQINDLSHEYEVRFASQAERIEELEGILQRTELERMRMMQKLRQSDNKAKKLQEVILGTSLKVPEFDDDVIQKGFQKLRFDILQLVKTYCTNHNASIKDVKYSCLSNEARDFWVMKVVASALHRQLFAKNSLYFGFDAEGDVALNDFYNNAAASKAVSPDDLAEWRARTCSIGKARDCQLTIRQARAREMAKSIWLKLSTYTPNTSSQAMDRTAIVKDARNALCSICENALSLALMLNGSKTEYLWAQEDNISLDSAHVAVVGSVRYRSFEECKHDYIIVFGGVLKGGGLEGRLSEDIVHLSDTDVILGPFPP